MAAGPPQTMQAREAGAACTMFFGGGTGAGGGGGGGPSTLRQSAQSRVAAAAPGLDAGGGGSAGSGPRQRLQQTGLAAAIAAWPRTRLPPYHYQYHPGLTKTVLGAAFYADIDHDARAALEEELRVLLDPSDPERRRNCRSAQDPDRVGWKRPAVLLTCGFFLKLSLLKVL